MWREGWKKQQKKPKQQQKKKEKKQHPAMAMAGRWGRWERWGCGGPECQGLFSSGAMGRA